MISCLMTTQPLELQDSPNSVGELDERQRARLHAASHKTLRVAMIALLVAFAFLSFYTDDLVIKGAIGLVVFATLGAETWFQRHEGVHDELESMTYSRIAREPVFGAGTVRMFAWFLVLSLGSHYAGGTLTWSVLPTILIQVTATALFIGWTLRALARRELRRSDDSTKDPAYTHGRRLGRWIAEKLRRRV